MDLKIHYKRSRIIVKKWEYKFQKLEGRKPTRADIKNASFDVRKAYRLYWLLKTSALQDSLLCTDDCDQNNVAADVDLEKVSKTDILSSAENEQINLQSPRKNDITANGKICTPERNKKSGNSSKVWGNHLNRSKGKSKTVRARPFSSQFTEKLFKGSYFSKRNPRKSLFANSKPVISETANIETSGESSITVPLPVHGTEEKEYSVLADRISILEDSTNIRINENSLDKYSASYSINTVEKSLKRNVNLSQARQLDEGWLERCNQNCSFSQPDSNKLPSSNNCDEESDDDIVYNSDDENSMQCFEFKHVIDIKSEQVVNNSAATNSSNDTADLNKKDALVSQECSISSALDNNCGDRCLDVNKSSSQNISINPLQMSSPAKLNHKPVSSRKSDLRVSLKSSVKQLSSLNRRKLEILERKVASGKANENFVRINLKKKIFVRGKKTLTGLKYKQQQWKMKKNQLKQGNSSDSSGIVRCFRCGDIGHYSRNCLQKGLKENTEENDQDMDDSPFPTLQEVAEMVNLKKDPRNFGLENWKTEDCSNSIDVNTSDDNTTSNVEPLYPLNEDGSLIDTPIEVFQTLLQFGYDEFRADQEETIMAILSGKSTLFVSATGSGKSLCYQIPAYLYAKSASCISLVISPLVSLMEDQIASIPAILKAGCLHTNQAPKEQEIVLEKLKNGGISVLLISPEAIINIVQKEHTGNNIINYLPPVAFVCIDEVHCISQWSHNFRPSYLVLCQVLRERLGVKTFLGLTATASMSTVQSIVGSLTDNKHPCLVIHRVEIPNNLLLSISKDDDRDAALLNLIQSSPFNEFGSIIVYCLRRNECDRIATYIRTYLQKEQIHSTGRRSRLSLQAEPYHAGISAARRKQIQKAFMSGQLRIVVATVAFGMGINKQDVRGIIHYNMPQTFEHYVQETGRAGRNGDSSHCHLFIDSSGNDLYELRRYIHSQSVDRHVIRKLLERVFVRCKCVDTCVLHEISFPVQETVSLLDLPEENISTLLCYLQLHPKKWIQVLTPTFTMCRIHSYNGLLMLKKIAKTCIPLSLAIAFEEHKSRSPFTSSSLHFSVTQLANYLQWDSSRVKKQLKSCEWLNENGKFRKTGISVEFSELSFHVRAPGNLSTDELDEILDTLYASVTSLEATSFAQLTNVYNLFNKYAYKTVEQCLKEQDIDRSEQLKQTIRMYFAQDKSSITTTQEEKQLKDEDTVVLDVRRLVSAYKDVNFTGRIVARIFHGIESPNFPAVNWARSPFWRAHLREDFNLLRSVATKELINFK